MISITIQAASATELRQELIALLKRTANLPDEDTQHDSTPVDEIGLPTRAANCLLGSGIDTVGDLRKRRAVDLLRLPELGHGTLAEIRVALSRIGVQLCE